LDEETGLYYYGARYYDPRISIWLGVDPLTEDYPNKTPYHFCSNSPVKRIDPNRQGDYYDSVTGDKLHNDGNDDEKVYVRYQSYTITIPQVSNIVDSPITIEIPQRDDYIGLKPNIPDKTEDFKIAMQQTNDFFSKKNAEFTAKESKILGGWLGKAYDRLDYFKSQVTNNSPYDLKRAEGPFNVNGDVNFLNGYGFFEGKLLRSDDFGNFNYGIAAKAFGVPEFVGEVGAGIRQFFDYFKRDSPMGGISTFFDDPKDNYMIKQGYKYYDANFKK
jgi:hypothetical protein